MALLRFQCEDCGKKFEELVMGSKTVKCPDCQSARVKRAYEGKCYFGSSGAAGTGGCSGSCATCAGCHH
ncbi:FmdB family zinc ribbon protein [Gehongia tenuis]|uniref:Zinc ribbon domain-containing protein n=1 Tax=Gehongia tenuis TaxID=2763655 RepID=A0A926HLI5_9FIRM|nr:zinc ribbon domain-containing protein [Gehongia tenuis]MBC8532112.1 zinc ribbon domain-containing protein [Gehongia tenuis]